MALSFEEALPGLQAAGHVNIMDALAAYNQGQQQAAFAPTVAAPAIEAPQGFLNLTSPQPTTPVSQTAPGGIAALPIAGPAYDPSKITNLESLYQYALGRPSDVGGKQYWAGIESGGITPEEYQRFMQVAQPELQVQQAFKNVLGRAADIPGLEYYTPLVQAGTLAPEKLQSTLAYGARSLADQLAAQKFLGKEVFGTPEQLRSTFATEYGKTVEDVIGKAEDVAELETALGLKAGDLGGFFAPTKWEQAGNIADIRKKLEDSTVNKLQEAGRTAAAFKNLYGLSDEQTKDYSTNLYTGKGIDSLANQYYKESLTGKPSQELQDKIIEDAAKKNPESPFFKANPNLRQIYTPIDKEISIDKGSGQYGTVNGLPLLSKKVADEDVLGNEVIRGLDKEFREDYKNLEKLGADIESDYRGRFAKGVGVFGVTANKNDVSDFSKIEKELEKLGGIKREADGTDYVDIPTADGVQRVRAQDFFDTGGEFAYNGAERYKLYNETKQGLERIAAQDKFDPSSFKDTKEMYDFFNDKYKDNYVWQGRTQALQLTPEQAQSLGIKYDPNDSQTHATINYVAKGDKLVPVLNKDKQVTASFQFQDPKADTIGREIRREILTNPVLLAAVSGYLGSTGIGAGLADSVGQSVITNLGLDATLANSGLTYAQIGELQSAIGRSILGGAQSGIVSALSSGDIEKFFPAFAAGTTGGILSGVTADTLGPTGSRILGSTASRALLNRDAEDYLLNQLKSEGISSLVGLTSPGAGEAARIMSVLYGPMTTGQLTPSDIVNLQKVLGNR